MRPALLACAFFSTLACTIPGFDSGETAADTHRVADSDADTGLDADTDAHADSDVDASTDTDTTPTVVYALRHAEKDEEADPDDPPLTEEGEARAEALALLLHDVPLSAVYATEYIRTQLTVEPTAEDHGLPILTDIDADEDLAAYILLINEHETVLSCGHSYTVPDLIEALGIADPPSADDYGDLWIITVASDGTATMETTRYGD